MSSVASNGLVHRITASHATYRILTLAIFAAAWEAYASQARSLLIPKFTDTVTGFFTLLTDRHFWEALIISNQALVLGFAISVVLGIPLGLAMGRFRVAERAVDVYLNILLVTPMAALIPILLMSPLGLSLASRVVLVVMFSIVMVVVNSRAGVRQVDPSLIEMARSFGASERQIWWRVLLPGSLPAVMTGVRIGLGRAVTGMVIVELLLVAAGIGGLILEYRGFFKADLLYGTVVIIVLEALALITVARWLERRVTPWARHRGVMERA
ncbi:MAG TPA: ABC transporter permease [Candidatus Limnocylindria bacterium]|nr:ABC transporter permease [Candidatus Limnocylindria bacterium]